MSKKKRSGVARSSRTERGVEVYLSEDILQGEEVPFFVTWHGPSLKSISLTTTGFAGISRLYNVPAKHLPAKELLISGKDLSAPGYLGGALTTIMSEEPVVRAQLDVTVEHDSGTSERFVERRTLHSARLLLRSTPREMSVSPSGGGSPAVVEVSGKATVALDIARSSSADIDLVLPSEVRNAYEKFAGAVASGMDRLKEEFPRYSKLIDELFELGEEQSLRQYYEFASEKLERVKEDKSFMEAFALVFVSALLGQTSVKDTLFIPLLEYLESNATTKVFLRSPFLSAKVPSGGGRLSCEIVARDLLGRQCGRPVAVEFRLNSDKDVLVPIKDLVQFTRIP